MADDKETKDVIDLGKAQGGRTATGQEADVRSGAEKERLDALESRGGPEPEDVILPDAIALKAPKNIGDQNEPAEFTTNGSIPANHVASNSGFVPVSAVVGSSDEVVDRMNAEAERIHAEKKVGNGRRVLDEGTINKMSGAELRAVAHDRGYSISDTAGTRAIRRLFTKAQEDDDTLDE